MSGSWKVAYADFMTAMMAFFLLMWILNMAPKETLNGLAEYFTEGAVYSTNYMSPTGNNVKVIKLDKLDTSVTDTDQSRQAIARLLREDLANMAIPANSRGVADTKIGVLMHITGDALYQPDSVDLTPEGKKVLDEVIKVMNTYNVFVVIRGHSSRDESGKPKYPSKWELSAARATAAVRYITDVGKISPDRVRSIAYADTSPLVPDTDVEGARKNRRVEFYFHRPEVVTPNLGY